MTLAGKVGVNGHIEVGDGVIIGAMSGVPKSVKPGAVVIGAPARPIRDYKINLALFNKLELLFERVKKLEQGIPPG